MTGSRRAWVVAAAVLVASGGVLGAGLHAPATAEPVVAETGASRTVLVLDASGSMAGQAGGGKSRIQAAKSALRSVVDTLPDDAEVGLRVFGAEVFSRTDPGSCEDSQLVVEPGTDNRDALRKAVAEYEPYGETPIPYALRQAAKDVGDTGVRSIVLVSDGETTCDPDPCEVAQELAEDGIDLRIDVVGLSVSGKARDQLKCIAESGNGDYFDADDAGDIEATLTRVAKRAVQPFTVGGTPISGGTESNPTPITPGQWVDTIGKDKKFYAFERTVAGSTLRVSAVTQGTDRVVDTVVIEISNPDGHRCDLGFKSRILRTREVTGVQATADEFRGCDQPGTYMIRASRGVRAEAEAQVGLRVTEEPPVEDPGFTGPTGISLKYLEITDLSFEGAAEPVAGSASFEAAPEITTGVWSSNIVAGEALVYRFRLEYGQSARVGLRFPAGTAAHREAFGSRGLLAGFSLHNPLLANLGFPDDGVSSGLVGGREEMVFRNATPQVSKVTGQGGGSFDGGGDYTAAGDYYLAVGVTQKESVEIPFRIDLQIEGEPAAGPTYVDGVSWSITDGLGAAEPSLAEADAEESDSGASAGDESESNGLRIGLGVGAGVLLAGVLVAALLRRRRVAT